MLTNFCEQLWIDFDLEIAVLIENLVSWIRYNASKEKPEYKNFHEGRYWSYDSYKELSKRFSGWSDQTIRRIIKRAVSEDLIIISNFNKKKYDNTNWYTLSDKALKYFPQLHGLFSYTPVEIDKPPVEIDRPIPEDLNSLSKNNINSNLEYVNTDGLDKKSDYCDNYDKGVNDVSKCIDCSSYYTMSDYHNNQSINKSDLSNSEQNLSNANHSRLNSVKASNDKPGKGGSIKLLRELIDVYRQEFPNNPQPHARVISTSLQKTLLSLINRWPELDPDGKPLTSDTFRRYLMALKSMAPKFSLGEYTTEHGNKKKNSLETFARWNTVVKFLENQYS